MLFISKSINFSSTIAQHNRDIYCAVIAFHPGNRVHQNFYVEIGVMWNITYNSGTLEMAIMCQYLQYSSLNNETVVK